MDFTRLEAKPDERRPLPPEILICALQDVVHKVIGKRRLVKAKRRLTTPAP